MAKIEIGRWSNYLRRVFGMAGVSDVAADLSPEISPVVVLEEALVDVLFLKDVRQVFAGDLLSAVALNNAKWRLRNPAGSGVIAIINGIEMSASQVSNWAIRMSTLTVDFPTEVTTTIPDLRWEALNVAAERATVVTSASNAGTAQPAGDTIAQSRNLASTPWQFLPPFPLLPGTTLDFGTTNVNVEVRMWVQWTERAFPILER